jgi:hypothetical protein
LNLYFDRIGVASTLDVAQALRKPTRG